MSKKTLAEKEKELMAKIDKAKKDLAGLQKKQKQEIGDLAYKHGLNNFDIGKLDSAFARLKAELENEHA